MTNYVEENFVDVVEEQCWPQETPSTSTATGQKKASTANMKKGNTFSSDNVSLEKMKENMTVSQKLSAFLLYLSLR